ncbi:DUF1958 domain-containing protein [Enterococcus sp. LJL99]
MLKRILMGIGLISLFVWSVPTFAEEDVFKITQEAGYTEAQEINKPKSSIIIDGTNGQILWQDNPDMPREPASISKMMTVFLVFDAIKEGKLTLDTEIVATEKDQMISQIYALSNNKIIAGVAYPVRELLKMTIVPSSNVATVMLANAVSDNDEGAFIQRMNEKAQALGMEHTTFYNCSGAAARSFEGLYEPEGVDPDGRNVSTARDLATMGFHLVKDYPEVLEFTNQATVTAMSGTPFEESFETYNYSLPGAEYGIEGVDGLKTGSGPSSAFNYIATAKRGDTRLIEVILGVGDWSDQDGEYYRHQFGNALLEKAFDEYDYQLILPKGDHNIDGKEIQLEDDFFGVVKKGQKPVLSIQGDQLVLNEPLEQSATSIPKLATTYKVISGSEQQQEPTQNGTPSQSQTTSQKEGSLLEKARESIYLIASSVIGVLLLLLSLVLPKSRVSKDERMKRTSLLAKIVRMIGLVCLFFAAVQWGITFLSK